MLIDACPLPLCCFNDSQNVRMKNNEHGRNREKKNKEKTSI